VKPESPRYRDSFEGEAAPIGGTDPSSEQEAKLIARIQRGERELFYELIRPYEKRVFVISFTILRNEAEAQDAAQDAFLKAFLYLGQFRAESRFSTWLIQVAINEARQRLRKSHLEIMRPIEDQENEDGTYTPREFTDWREIPSEALERKEVREKLLSALGSLAHNYREVFILRDVEHMSIDDTAKVLGISSGAVKTRLLRARLMLRDLLSPGLTGSWTSSPELPKGTKPWS
jgi:RNA polymerase sigma-70 factor (ECF subfamily)